MYCFNLPKISSVAIYSPQDPNLPTHLVYKFEKLNLISQIWKFQSFFPQTIYYSNKKDVYAFLSNIFHFCAHKNLFNDVAKKSEPKDSIKRGKWWNYLRPINPRKHIFRHFKCHNEILSQFYYHELRSRRKECWKTIQVYYRKRPIGMDSNVFILFPFHSVSSVCINSLSG